MSAPRIAVCMIVRDWILSTGRLRRESDGATVPHYVALLDVLLHTPGIDEVVIVDTGSKDTTFERLREIELETMSCVAGTSARLMLRTFAWVDDFSKARNYSFGCATADWRGHLDADDMITAEDARRLVEEIHEAHAAECDALVVQYRYGPDAEEWPIRFVRWDAGWRWERRVHETLHPTLLSRKPRAAFAESVVVQHTREATSSDAHGSRNARLAKLGYEEAHEAGDVNAATIYAFTLAHDAYVRGDFATAERLYEEAATGVPGAPIGCAAAAHRAWRACEANEWDVAEKWAGHSIAVDESYADGWFILGIALFRQKRYEPATIAFDGGRAARTRRLAGLIRTLGHAYAALAYIGAGRLDDARAMLASCLVTDQIRPIVERAEAALAARTKETT